MSDSQVGYEPEWYKAARRKHEAQEKARRREIEERVHAILAMEDMLTKVALLNQFISLDPDKAFEMLAQGGYVGDHHD